MNIIGLCGKAGSGKGTVSEIIKNNYHNVNIFPLAAELKRIARDEFDWNGDKDERGRKLLQVLGTSCGRGYGGENFWVTKWENKINNWVKKNNNDSFIIVCDDVRFNNEAQRILDMGGVIIKVTGRYYTMLEESMNHPSEKGISDNLINFNINNDSNMEHLEIEVKKILNYLGY